MKFSTKGQTKFSWRRISQSEIRNSAAAESEGGPRRIPPRRDLRGKQKFLLFACPVASRRLCYGARPSVQFGARSAPSVPFKIGSDFVKQTHQNQTFRFFGSHFVGGAQRRRISYFALRNAPPKSAALVPPAHTQATIRNSKKTFLSC